MKINTLIFAICAIFINGFFKSNVYAGLEKETASTAALKAHEAITDSRINQLNQFLSDNKSDLANYASHFVHEADRLSIDWKLVAAIAGLESTYCKHIPQNSYNCWGWGIPTGTDSGVKFDSYMNGITIVSEGLRYKYFNRGLSTIEDVGRVYAASPTWAMRVRYIMNNIDTYSPKPFDKMEVTI